MSTQEILKKLYESVVELLVDRLIDFESIFKSEEQTLANLADELQISVSDLSNTEHVEDKRDTARITLLPIAQECVVYLIRAVLRAAINSSNPQFSNERLEYIAEQYAFDWDNFPKSLGLDEERAKFAVTATLGVIKNTNLFDSTVSLSMDGTNFEITRYEDGFRIKQRD